MYNSPQDKKKVRRVKATPDPKMDMKLSPRGRLKARLGVEEMDL